MTIKRVFDVTVCILALPFLLPLFIVAALFIKSSGSGPVFYRGLRVGCGGVPFRIFKFRTMVVDAEKLGGTSTAHNDPRLIPGGAFLRKYKIDELPQVINVLRGEMSIVGPRPQIESLTRHYTEEERQILTVPPGLTDYASIRFINLGEILGDENVEEKYMREIEPEKTQLRLRYVRERNFLIDIKIIGLTALRMLRIPRLFRKQLLKRRPDEL